MIIIGGYILFDARGHTENRFTYRRYYINDSFIHDELITPSSEELDSTILGLLYVFAGLFILFLFILTILFSLNRFPKFKTPKLYSRTSIASIEITDESKYTPLITDV